MALDLEKLKALEAAATPGPWRACEAMRDEGRCSCGLVGQDDGGIIADFGPDELIADCGGPMRETRPVNASFVAAARNALPGLIAEVERLRGLAANRQQTIEGLDAYAIRATAAIERERDEARDEVERLRAWLEYIRDETDGFESAKTWTRAALAGEATP